VRRAIATIGLCALALVAAACSSGSSGGSDAATTTTSAQRPVEKAVDIGGGRRMFVECRGQGSPTVVLISGKGNGADDWLQVLAPGDPEHDAAGDNLPWGKGKLVHSRNAVLPSVARFTRVCAYDRPDVRVEGADLTTPRAQPHTADLDVEDLHALLGALGERGPFVLVPHSYGGVIADLYARTYPRSIGGLVLVDAVTERMADVVNRAKLADWDAANAATSAASREGVHLIDAFEKIDSAGPRPKVPTIILSADKPWRLDLLPPEAKHADMVEFADWLAAQDRLAEELDVEHITKTKSGHDIYLYSPQLVVDAIRDVVDDVRAEGHH
jgi:pimeloyl-ACP methyl ester carboxylesterase